jgi:hypothetical protein
MADNTIFLGKSDVPQVLYVPMANRHALVRGILGNLTRR